MKIDRYKLIERVNEMANGEYCFDEIAKFCKWSIIEVTLEELQEQLTAMAINDDVKMEIDTEVAGVRTLKELSDERILKRVVEEYINSEKRREYSVNKIDYDLRKQRFEIYSTKCAKLVKIITTLVYGPRINEKVLKELDITLDKDCIDEKDVERIVKPLFVNYQRAKEAKAIAENPESYKNKISPVFYTDFLPSKLILEPYNIFSIRKNIDEFIPMTDKQREMAKKEHEESMRRIFSGF